jgi:hypothetical protein
MIEIDVAVFTFDHDQRLLSTAGERLLNQAERLLAERRLS